MSLFTNAATTGGATLNLPNSKNGLGEVTFKINGPVRLQAQRTFVDGKPSGPVKRNSDGKIADQWVFDVLNKENEDSRVYIDKFSLKQALGKALMEAKRETFAMGDIVTITFDGQEKNDRGFYQNKYKAKVEHKGGEDVDTVDEIEQSAQAQQSQQEQVYQQTYGQPPAGQAQPPAPQGNYAAQPPVPGSQPSPW